MKRVGQGARPLKLQAVCLVERFSEVGLQTPSSSSPQLLKIQIVGPSPELPNQKLWGWGSASQVILILAKV